MKPYETKEHLMQQAKRYYANAEELFKEIPVEYDERYTDPKLVSKAAAIAYLAALLAIEAYLVEKGISKDKLPNSIEAYRMMIKKNIPHNGKLMAKLNNVYDYLHLGAYYRRQVGVEEIKLSRKSVKEIIEMLEKK